LEEIVKLSSHCNGNYATSTTESPTRRPDAAAPPSFFQKFDNLATRTNLLVSWADRSMARSGDLDFGPAGITPLDTVRLGRSARMSRSAQGFRRTYATSPSCSMTCREGW